MKITWKLSSVGAAALLAALAFAGPDLYTPNRSVKDQGISLKGWGSGTASETNEMAFDGTSSIRVSSRNYFQGGILNYSSPVNLASAFDSKDNLLWITFQVPTGSTALGGGSGPSLPGGIGGDSKGGGGQKGGGTGGGNLNAPIPGGKGGGAAGGDSSSAPAVTMLRVVLTTSDGKKSETYLNLSSTKADEKGWRSVGVPLQAISGFSKTNKMISAMAFSTDSVASVYVGEVKIQSDATPIYGEPNVREMNLALGDQVTFSGSGFGGATPLRYTWDFDSADGVGVDSEGQSVIRRFRKPGDYTITLTITDIYGLKKPYTTTIKVTVNP